MWFFLHWTAGLLYVDFSAAILPICWIPVAKCDGMRRYITNSVAAFRLNRADAKGIHLYPIARIR